MKRGVLFFAMLITAAGLMAQVRGVPGEVLPSGRTGVEARPRATSPVEAEVRSQHFVLVDDKGKDRASLVADGAGSVFLVLFDAAGKTRANLSVGNDGPSLVFYDASGQPRTIIGATTLVASHVNESGIVEKSPASSIVLFDKAGKLLWREP
jgi:hypothetical protein